MNIVLTPKELPFLDYIKKFNEIADPSAHSIIHRNMRAINRHFGDGTTSLWEEYELLYQHHKRNGISFDKFEYNHIDAIFNKLSKLTKPYYNYYASNDVPNFLSVYCDRRRKKLKVDIDVVEIYEFCVKLNLLKLNSLAFISCIYDAKCNTTSQYTNYFCDNLGVSIETQNDILWDYTHKKFNHTIIEKSVLGGGELFTLPHGTALLQCSMEIIINELGLFLVESDKLHTFYPNNCSSKCYKLSDIVTFEKLRNYKLNQFTQ
jgi:hypothetical protein